MENRTLSNIVLEQRVRNNIIKHFELASSEEELIKYQTNVPIAVVPNELIQSWYDEFQIDYYNKADCYTLPVYTEEERELLFTYNTMMDNVCKEMPDDIWDINDVFKLPLWPKLKKESEIALAIFMKRGLFSDDVEMKKIIKRQY